MHMHLQDHLYRHLPPICTQSFTGKYIHTYIDIQLHTNIYWHTTHATQLTLPQAHSFLQAHTPTGTHTYRHTPTDTHTSTCLQADTSRHVPKGTYLKIYVYVYILYTQLHAYTNLPAHTAYTRTLTHTHARTVYKCLILHTLSWQHLPSIQITPASFEWSHPLPHPQWGQWRRLVSFPTQRGFNHTSPSPLPKYA